MKLLTKLFFLLSITAMITTGCGNDDEDNTPDLTAQATGTYIGTYEEGDASSSLEFEDVEVQVTRTSNSAINIKMIVIPGLAETDFQATMDTETTFTVTEFALPDQNVQGTGSIQNENTLELDLSGVDDPNYSITFSGLRQ